LFRRWILYRFRTSQLRSRATAGNLWGWQPNSGSSTRIRLAAFSTVFQIGVVRPQFADTQLQANPATGSALAASHPDWVNAPPSRLSGALRRNHAMMDPKQHSARAHYGRERIGRQRDLESGSQFDFSVPLASTRQTCGEGFVAAISSPSKAAFCRVSQC